MVNLKVIQEKIGLIKWFGDATKTGEEANYGYLQDLENSGDRDLRINQNSLNCCIEDIKGKNGLLVTFELANYKPVNVKPILLTGYVEFNTTKNIVLDLNTTLAQRIEQIIKSSTIIYQKSLNESNRPLLILRETPVCFNIIEKSNNYEAHNLYLLKNEDKLDILAAAVESKNQKIAVIAFNRYLSILPEQEALKVAIEKIKNFSLECIPKKLLYLSEAKVLREQLPVSKHFKLCFDLVQTDSQFTNELALIAKKASESDWQGIPENNINTQIHYQNALWRLAPDFIKARIGAKYLSNKPDQEALEIANNLLKQLSNEQDKSNFVTSIPDNIKILIEAKLIRNFLTLDAKLRIYQQMILNHDTDIIISSEVDKEINSGFPQSNCETINRWFTGAIADKVVYKGFLWDSAPKYIKQKILRQRFAQFLTLIENFQQYPFAQNLTADTSFYSKLTESDKKLIKCWLNLDKQKSDYHKATMLSARTAEKFAIQFYESLGHQVQDISIQQLNPDNSDWHNCDLRLDNEFSIDIKNARTNVNNKKGYSEFTVKGFKNNQNKQEVTIAAVLSPYLKLNQIETPYKINYENCNIIFLGELKNSELDEMSNFFKDKFAHIDMPRDCQNRFLPPWLFDYPKKTFYRQQEEVISQIKILTDYDLPDGEELKILEINPLPLYTAAKTVIPEKWQLLLQPWQKKLISQLAQIPSHRITLPYLFLSLLSHFLDMLKHNDDSYEPQKYEHILYMNQDKYPLGIYDPLHIIGEFCETLSILWNNRKQTRINEFKIFKFVAQGLLKGKKDKEDNMETTILAYCGGKTEQKVFCGYKPLVLGKDYPCSKCGKLICPKCNYCSEDCPEKIKRIEKLQHNNSNLLQSRYQSTEEIQF